MSIFGKNLLSDTRDRQLMDYMYHGRTYDAQVGNITLSYFNIAVRTSAGNETVAYFNWSQNSIRWLVDAPRAYILAALLPLMKQHRIDTDARSEAERLRQLEAKLQTDLRVLAAVKEIAE